MNDIDVKSLLLKISQAIDAQIPTTQSLQERHSDKITSLDSSQSQQCDSPGGDGKRLIVKNPWTGEHYSWGEEVSTHGFSIPYSCISTEYKHLSHAGRSLRMITLFLAYGPEGKKGVIELKKSHIRETYNFDTRTLERAIYELREAGLLIEIGRERNLRNKPMRYFVMVPVECFGQKGKALLHMEAQSPSISPPAETEVEAPAPTSSKPKFPSVFDYKEAKELVQKFYTLISRDIPDPGKLLNETLLCSEMIRFYGKDGVEAALEYLPNYPQFISNKPKSFRWFSSCIGSIQEHIKKPKKVSGADASPSSATESLTEDDTDENRKKKLAWIHLSETEQLLVKDKVLDLYPFIKNEDVLENIAQEMAYQQRPNTEKKPTSIKSPAKSAQKRFS